MVRLCFGMCQGGASKKARRGSNKAEKAYLLLVEALINASVDKYKKEHPTLTAEVWKAAVEVSLSLDGT